MSSLLTIGLFVISIRTMAATALTTIASFEMVLFCKTFITFWGEVEIAFF